MAAIIEIWDLVSKVGEVNREAKVTRNQVVVGQMHPLYDSSSGDLSLAIVSTYGQNIGQVYPSGEIWHGPKWLGRVTLQGEIWSASKRIGEVCPGWKILDQHGNELGRVDLHGVIEIQETRIGYVSALGEIRRFGDTHKVGFIGTTGEMVIDGALKGYVRDREVVNSHYDPQASPPREIDPVVRAAAGALVLLLKPPITDDNGDPAYIDPFIRSRSPHKRVDW